MKRILILLLALEVVSAFRQHGPMQRRMDSSDSSISSEEDSSEEVIRPKPFEKKNQQRQQPQPEPIKKGGVFDRPSSEELEAYDAKVQRQNRNKLREMLGDEEPVRTQGKPKPTMDETDEKAFLAVLGQIYLDKAANEGPFGGPMGPVGPPMDADYYFVPMDYDTPKQANNNGNNNVHVNVNHVQVNSNVLHVPGKEDKKAPPPPPPAPRDELPPMIPSYHYTEPITTSKYLYLNLNMTDCVFLLAMVAVFLFAAKKVYTKCFPKKQVAPQLPTTMPPTYTPSTITVETVPKKMVPQ